MEVYPITGEDFYKVNGLKDKCLVDELFMEDKARAQLIHSMVKSEDLIKISS